VQFEGNRELLRLDISQEEFEGLIYMLESISEKVSIASGHAYTYNSTLTTILWI
jgi:hypothetical protein